MKTPPYHPFSSRATFSRELTFPTARHILVTAVRENLMFACKMYNPDLAQGDCDSRVDEVLASLGLEACQHTKVGVIERQPRA